MTLKVWLKSVFTYNFKFVAYLGYRNITFFPYRSSLRFQVQVPSTLYVVFVFESSIQTYVHGACWNTFECNFVLKFEFGDLESSRSTGEDLEIVLCGYITMKMNPDDKLSVVIAFEISPLLCWSARVWAYSKQRLWTQRASSGPTHKRTEGRAPVWGSEFFFKRL